MRLLVTSTAAAAISALILGTCTTPATAGGPQQQSQLVTPAQAYNSVDPWIGTQDDSSQDKGNRAYGNTWPGAAAPFGMTQFTPTTYRSSDQEASGGYEYTADKLRGFGMTRLSGTGCDGRNSAFDLPLLPYTGDVTDDGAPSSSPGKDIAPFYLGYDHDRESSAPGYYSVGLRNGTGAKLTATQRTTVGQFTFPTTSDSSATMLFNVSGSNNNKGRTKIDIDPTTHTISGYTTGNTVCDGGKYRVYFSSSFDAGPTSYGVWDGDKTKANTRTASSEAGKDKTGAWLGFKPGAKVTFRTGISYVSVQGAAKNRRHESQHRGFKQVKKQARHKWEQALGTVKISAKAGQGGNSTDDQRSIFYTSLYHSLLHPNIYDDVDRKYRRYGKQTSMDSHVQTLRPGQDHEYVTYTGWDSFRGQMQMVALLFPKIGSDINQSLTNLATQTGSWYNWPHLGSGQNKMNGDALQPMLAAMDAFGSTDYDRRTALRSMLSSQSLPATDSTRSDVLSNVAVGFLEDRQDNSASTTLDYAMADFGIAQLAHRLGERDGAQQFMTRAQHWQNLVSTKTHAIEPRDRKGYWDFDLTVRDSDKNKPDPGAHDAQFDQSTGHQYQWSVPFNVDRLIAKLGGSDAAKKKLDTLFKDVDAGVYGTTGAYMSNQPSMHAPWIYSWLGRPNTTTQVLDRTRNQLYTTGPKGLAGNDDLGSLSSWNVWSSIGLYPGIFGRAELLESAPAFDRVHIASRGSARRIDINAPGAADNRTITGSTVNGTTSTKSWLPESFAQKGGRLDLTMDGEAAGGPADTAVSAQHGWGAGANDRPPSFDQGTNRRNAIGTASAGAQNQGSVDFSGHALPRKQLRKAGAAPGATLKSRGVRFTWPRQKPGEFDSWVPHGQRVQLNSSGAGRLSFLGLATNGPSSGTATVAYTDGTTDKVTLEFADWTGGGEEPDNGNAAVVTVPTRTTADGGSDKTPSRVYATKPVKVDAGKTIDHVVLPRDVKSGVMHIFAIGTDQAEH